ncbi:MAG: hypothetical protein ABIY55_32985 [Kofleriaceae bacterium]
MMLRVLAYDIYLAQRTPDTVTLLVVHPRDEEGAACAAQWVEAFDRVRKVKVAGRLVQVFVHGFGESSDLDRALNDLDVTALIDCDGLARKLAVAALAKLTRAHKVLSFAMREDDVAAGLSVAIVSGRDPDQHRDEIVVNPRAAAAEGVKFDAGLMQLARTAGEP